MSATISLLLFPRSDCNKVHWNIGRVHFRMSLLPWDLKSTVAMAVCYIYLPWFCKNQINTLAAATLLVDLEQLLSSAISTSKSSNGDDQKNIQLIVGAIRAALGAVLTPGLNVDIDSICRDRLKLSRASASSGFYRQVMRLWWPTQCMLTTALATILCP